MSWKKYFQPIQTGNNPSGNYSPMGGLQKGNSAGPARSNYSSYLPDVYVGSPNRVERYGQYNTMDLDSEVNAALDILAEFCTQTNTQNKTPFLIDFKTKATNSEATVLQQYLQQWCKLQNFETRMFRILRNTFKYGDQFFIRDPETKKWFHVDPANVTRIIVNESEGKKPEQYVVKDFNLNFGEMVATTPYETNGNVTGGGSGYLTGGVRGMVGQPQQAMGGNRFMTEQREIAVDAEHVVHLSLSEGLDTNYYQISKEGDPSNTFSAIYGDSTDPASVASLGIVDGDRIICTTNQTGTKEFRQKQKLDIAAVKRSDTYDITQLPTQYSGNDVVDNPNAGGLVERRPWNTP